MTDFFQGDIIRINGYKYHFLIISKNAYIQAVNAFHVCPLIEDCPAGPVHITVSGVNGFTGTAICDQIKFIDPSARSCNTVDRIPYGLLMDVSDAVQAIFEYD